MIPAIITHSFDLDLGSSPIHYYSKWLIIPLAILSVMSAMSFSQLKIVGLKPIILFVSGSFIIAILPPVLVKIIGIFKPALYADFMSAELWKGLVPIVGSWIGGSTSQLVLKEVVDCSEELFVSVLVLDNILVNIWTIFMFQMIKRSDQINRWLQLPTAKPPLSSYADNDTKKSSSVTLAVIALVAVCFFIIDISFLSNQHIFCILVISSVCF